MAWLEVKVYKRSSSGQMWPYEYAKVSAKTTGFTGGFIDDVRTDSDGEAVLKWSNNDKDIDAIYIDGTKYSGPYSQGRTVRIVVNV